MLRKLLLAIFVISIYSCKKEPSQLHQLPNAELPVPDSTYFIYKGPHNIRITCLEGYPKKRTLDLSGHHDRKTLEVNLYGDKSPEIKIWQEYNHHNYWSPSKQGQSIEAAIEGLPEIRFHAKRTRIWKEADFYSVLSNILLQDTIWIDSTNEAHRAEISYCSSNIGVDYPSFCRSSLYLNSAWIDGNPHEFLCWSSADTNQPVAYLINLQFPKRHEFLINYVMKLEFNVTSSFPCQPPAGLSQQQ